MPKKPVQAKEPPQIPKIKPEKKAKSYYAPLEAIRFKESQTGQGKFFSPTLAGGYIDENLFNNKPEDFSESNEQYTRYKLGAYLYRFPGFWWDGKDVEQLRNKISLWIVNYSHELKELRLEHGQFVAMDECFGQYLGSPITKETPQLEEPRNTLQDAIPQIPESHTNRKAESWEEKARNLTSEEAKLFAQELRKFYLSDEAMLTLTSDCLEREINSLEDVQDGTQPYILEYVTKRLEEQLPTESAASLHKFLGVHVDERDHYKLAERIVKRPIKSLTELTTGESLKIRHEIANRVEKKAA